MINLQAFHNDKAIKAEYLARVKAHEKADAIIQGTGWSNGKGCAVGCTLENYEHSQYPIELGIPEWLARVEDILFEGMPAKDAKKWPVKFLQAINVGADLEKAKVPFLLVVLNSALETLETNINYDKAAYPDVYAANEGSKRVLIDAIDCLKKGLPIDERAAAAAWAAAGAARAAGAAEAAKHKHFADQLLIILKETK